MENENKKSDGALREEKVLEFWRENKIFEKSLEQTKGKKEFVFYEGPPTANAKPGLHHLEARAFKDAIPRYKTMQGYHVRRKGGWDTHGLPVELQVEKKLGFKSKNDIEVYGIAKFNQECKENVWEQIDLWSKFTDRIGYWVDQEHAYVTYHNDYMESVWNIIKKVDEQKLLYKDYRVVPWCTRCGTALSSHELAQGYQEIKDLSVYAKFKIVGTKNGYFLAWTTTPWTLPGNVALAVGADIDYVEAKVGDEILVLAKEKLSLLPEGYEIVAEHKGSEMVGMAYEPLFPFLKEQLEKRGEPTDKAFKVYTADFVNTEDGTGIVHTAVMYGQDDFELGTKLGLPKYHMVNPDGKFIPGTGFLEGRYVRETNADGKPTLAVDIIEELKKKNLFFKQENYKHEYPHCWRCGTALIYYARDSWYIRMSAPKVKNELISQNKKINWEPHYIKNGRFGEWLREVKDWAISRERYWGTPLPVWSCEKCEKREVIGSFAELKNRAHRFKNQYFVIRHGEAENNTKLIVDYGQQEFHLTPAGRQQVSASVQSLRDKNIEVIISSDILRTKETAEIVEKGLDKNIDSYDVRLREFNFGEFAGKSDHEWREFSKDYHTIWAKGPAGGESLQEMRERLWQFLQDCEKKYTGKNILLVTHEYDIWLLRALEQGWDEEELIAEKIKSGKDFIGRGEWRHLDFRVLPRNSKGEIDLHRPFIDEVTLVCACGGQMVRAKEVMDVWLDSGAMPFAQDHYPFENKAWVEGQGYPADYISEAIDQTRGWFYTLHAVGILMERGKAFKNVICLGHLLDAKGKKMSKSLGNTVDPWQAMDAYGVDALRLWMYSVNQPGESKNFDEKTVALLNQQVFGLLYNVLAFYELYRDKNVEVGNKNPERPQSKNILDQWILAELDELVILATENLDSYKLLEPTRAIRDFVGDLSTWYLRRSRDRIKDGDKGAKQTLYFVLKTLAKVMAPVAPFSAEDIWLKLKNESDEESVHLARWPRAKSRMFLFKTPKVLENMEIVRQIVTLGLEARQKAGIKVRQPLNTLDVIAGGVPQEYIEIIKDELNIKNINYILKIKIGLYKVNLDTHITPALKAEGEYREFMRELQDRRKQLGLKPSDSMPMTIEDIYKKYRIFPRLQMHMLRVAAVASMICDNLDIELDKNLIVTTCLLHDLGNIIKSKNVNYFSDFSDEEVVYWQAVKNEFIKKYGEDEHQANLAIIHELGMSDEVVRLADKFHFSLTCRHAEGDDMYAKISVYSDHRVAPNGVVSYLARMAEAKVRYKDTADFQEETRQKLVDCGLEIEKQIFAHSKIKPENITEEAVASIIEKLRGFVIK